MLNTKLTFYYTALANKNIPRTIGDGIIHESHIDAIVEQNYVLPELSKGRPTPEEDQIGKLIAENLVEDGATLQMGKYLYASIH